MNDPITPYRVLVVDDRPEMRDVMRSTVESLGNRVDVTAVPSGEEALLEIRLQPFDLLVADVLLPGINGMELMGKARAYRPELKVILVTGVVDQQLRQAAAGAGADAFFLKPMEPTDFLVSIKECLDLVEPGTQASVVGDDQQSEDSPSERLARLHQELGGIASVLTDEHGRIQAQAGDLSDETVDSGLITLLMASLSAARKVAYFAGSNTPKDLSYFVGKNYDIFVAHVGDLYALVSIVQPVKDSNELGLTVDKIYKGVRDLDEILTNIGIHVDPEILVDRESDTLNDEDLEVDKSEVDALFTGVDGKLPGNEEVDAFWDSVTKDDKAGGFQNADVLTYDQARQLGIAPEDDEE
jgi:CheY-like chemotaxis protein